MLADGSPHHRATFVRVFGKDQENRIRRLYGGQRSSPHPGHHQRDLCRGGPQCTAVLFGNTQENTTVNNIPEETEINVVDFTKLNYESLCAILLRDNLTHELDPDTRSFIEDLVEAAEVTSEEEGYRNFSMAYHGDSIPSSSSSSSIPSSRSILPSSSSSSTRP